MPVVSLDYKVVSHIREHGRLVSVPVVEAAALVGERVRERVRSRGEASEGGTFGEYAESTARSRRRRGLPIGPIRFELSGRMWDYMQVKLLRPGHARVSFGGKAKSGERVVKGKGRTLRNADVARIQQAATGKQILGATEAERQEMAAYLAGVLTDQAIEAIGLEGKAFEVSRRGRSIARRAKRALAELGRARGG